MRFVSLEIRTVRIPFRFSFKHALADRKCADSVIIKITTDNGTTGWGEAVPRSYLTGENVDSVVEDIENLWWPAIREIDFSTKEPALKQLKPVYSEADRNRKTASYAAIDIAVIDALARTVSKPVWQYLDFQQKTPTLTAPLGGKSLKGICSKALLFRLLGFKEYKIKIGMGCDKACARAARKIIGSSADLRADANAAWDTEEALNNLKTLTEFSLSSVEQPVNNIDGLAKIRKELGLKVMADESLCNTSDAQQLLQAEACDIWNVRLAKNGGFSGLKALQEIASQNNIQLHLGTLVGETSLLAAAGRTASGSSEFLHVEYGFPRILLKKDPFRGGPAGYFGTGEAASRQHGLGISHNFSVLGKITISHKLLQ